MRPAVRQARHHARPSIQGGLPVIAKRLLSWSMAFVRLSPLSPQQARDVRPAGTQPVSHRVGLNLGFSTY